MFALFHAVPRISISLAAPSSPVRWVTGTLMPPLEIKQKKPREIQKLANQVRPVSIKIQVLPTQELSS